MEALENKPRKSILQRVARIWSIALFLFAVLVVIGEVADPHTEADYPPIENLLPILMLLSIVSLGLAWRNELWAGILNILFFLANFILYWVINDHPLPMGGLAMLSLAIVPGILFLFSWRHSRQMIA